MQTFGLREVTNYKKVTVKHVYAMCNTSNKFWRMYGCVGVEVSD